MTIEDFYEESYEDSNYFYTTVRGVSVVSPKKVQGAMMMWGVLEFGRGFTVGTKAANEELVLICQEFIRRVDKGEVKSTYTYSRMVTALKVLNIKKEPELCEWMDDGDVHETSCGNTFIFNADGPKENGFKSCPYCSKKIK